MAIVYRFRDTNKLLDEYHELENQTIHFSPLECLNDPMEGYLNLFFMGDRIVWENLFFHYIVCIDDTFSCMKTGIDIFAKEHEFPLFNYDSYFDGPHQPGKKRVFSSYVPILVCLFIELFVDKFLLENPTTNSLGMNAWRKMRVI